MEELIKMVIQLTIEVLILVFGYLGSSVLRKYRAKIDAVRERDKLGIIDHISERVTEYAEAELKGAKGIEKRNFAVQKALKMLEARGILLEEDEVIAAIESGVLKLKEKQKSLNDF